MADDVELVQDSEGLAVVGERGAVKRFLEHAGLWAASQDLEGLGSVLDIAPGVAEAALSASSTAGRYVKLTEESARDIRELGLVPTKTDGVSYAMVGQRGSITKWVRIETGVTARLTNPAILSGAAGIMAQIARQQEMEELRQLIKSIDGKLDDVRRRQRDEVLAKMDGARCAIDEAVALSEGGGDRETAWRKVENTKETVFNVEADALRAIGVLSDKVDKDASARTLRTTTEEVAKEVAVWLAVLAACFQLEDQHAVLELDHVRATAPSKLDAHRLSLDAARCDRRDKIVKMTAQLMRRLDEAGGVAGEKVVLHWKEAQAVVDSVNAVGAEIEQFYAPLGVEPQRVPLTAPGWREALRDPQQRRKAREEAQPVVAGVVGTVLLAVPALAGWARGPGSAQGDSDDHA
ncbi:MAG: hypothetical protein Q4C85_07280 [Actinomyces sp.]|uniref:hypothetical protein n=1 Tax=Actinomyces sp. TaxID=29317 RepID=UPI0026DDB62A|nr:hypothetical protein [Actinomyces sp.]MDO4243545.1 hypothetical protein [Actinomyces sp.]